MKFGQNLFGYFGAVLVALVFGYFVGREHLKYEIQTTSHSDAQEMQKNLPSGLAIPSSPETTEFKTQTPSPSVEDIPLTVNLLEKGFQESDYQAGIIRESITISVSFENHSDRDIRAFDGVLVFNDLLDNRVFASSLAINELVQKNSELKWNGKIDYNQFIDSHQRFRNENQENLKVSFILRKILFADGTTNEFK